jgi:hypothetical protein
MPLGRRRGRRIADPWPAAPVLGDQRGVLAQPVRVAIDGDDHQSTPRSTSVSFTDINGFSLHSAGCCGAADYSVQWLEAWGHIK